MASEAEAFEGEPRRELAPEVPIAAFVVSTVASIELVQQLPLPDFMKFGLEVGTGLFVAGGVWLAARTFLNRSDSKE